MKPRSNTLTLFLSIIITGVSIPLAVLSIYGRLKYPATDTPSCDLTLTGGACYVCDNKDGYCGYAYNYITDSNYYINYYKEGTNYLTSAGDFIFIMDNVDTFDINDATKYPYTFLYNTSTNSKTSAGFRGLNNYGIGLDGGYYIAINDEGKYGLYLINSIVTKVVDYDYDFIGAVNHLTSNGKLDAEKLVVLNGTEWSLLSPEANEILTTTFTNSIYDFTNNVVILYEDNAYCIKDYNGIDIFNTSYSKVYVYDEIVLLIDNNYNIYMYDSTMSANSIDNPTLIATLSNLAGLELIENNEEEYVDIYNNTEPIKRIYYNGTISNIEE